MPAILGTMMACPSFVQQDCCATGKDQCMCLPGGGLCQYGKVRGGRV